MSHYQVRILVIANTNIDVSVNNNLNFDSKINICLYYSDFEENCYIE